MNPAMETGTHGPNLFSIVSHSAKSISLEIQALVDSRVENLDRARHTTEELRERLDYLDNEVSKQDSEIDPDDAVTDSLLGIEKTIENILAKVKQDYREGTQLPASAAADFLLCATDDFLETLHAVHAQLEQTRWHIMEHDADYSELIEQSYTSASELIADLTSKRSTTPMSGMAALEWLLHHDSKGTRTKNEIDQRLQEDRDW